MDALKSRPDDETTFVPKAPQSFQRGACRVQHWISPKGEADSPFPAEPGRYHVFVNYGCGWCHQLLQVIMLRGLEESISITHTGLHRGAGRGTPQYEGYVIPEGADKSGYNFRNMNQVYNIGHDGSPTGDPEPYGVNQLTVPVLFCKKTKRVVSNDPAQMLMMLDYLAEDLGGGKGSTSLYPEKLRDEIEHVNSIVFPGVNNGVYCCWFGGEPGTPAFDEGYDLVQNGLVWLEKRLEDNKAKSKAGPYLLGTESPTLADVRAFPHLFRFDSIYFELMLRNQGKRIFKDFPLVAEWVRDHMFNFKSASGELTIQRTCDMQVATRFYFSSKPVEESDSIFDREREASGGWLPSREQLAVKRKEEGMSDSQISIPYPR